MKLSTTILGCIAACASIPAAATDDFGRTITSVGAAGTSSYVVFKEGTSVPCMFGIVYLGDTSQPTPKAMLAIVLAAQARGVALAAVSYDADASGICTATNIHS